MKHSLKALFTIILIFSLAACGRDPEPPAPPTAIPAEEVTEEVTEDTSESSEESTEESDSDEGASDQGAEEVTSEETTESENESTDTADAETSDEASEEASREEEVSEGIAEEPAEDSTEESAESADEASEEEGTESTESENATEEPAGDSTEESAESADEASEEEGTESTESENATEETAGDSTEESAKSAEEGSEEEAQISTEEESADVVESEDVAEESASEESASEESDSDESVSKESAEEPAEEASDEETETSSEEESADATESEDVAEESGSEESSEEAGVDTTDATAEEVVEPRVFFLQPTNNAVIPPVSTIVMGTEGLIVEPAGEIREGAGHLHILVDTDFIAAGEVIPSDEKHLHYGKAQLSAEVELTPGEHTLRLQFANGAHIALEGDAYRAEINVTVAEDAPEQGVYFVSPSDGDTVSNPIDVIMAASGMVIEPAGEIREGAGHLHILVNTEFVAPGEVIINDETHLHYGKAQTETTLELEPGEYVLRLQLANGAHIALEGEQYQDEINITVE